MHGITSLKRNVHLSTLCSSLYLSSEYGSERLWRTCHWYCSNPALHAFNVFSFLHVSHSICAWVPLSVSSSCIHCHLGGLIFRSYQDLLVPLRPGLMHSQQASLSSLLHVLPSLQRLVINFPVFPTGCQPIQLFIDWSSQQQFQNQPARMVSVASTASKSNCTSLDAWYCSGGGSGYQRTQGDSEPV